MNREFLPEAVLGITVALLLAVLAVYRSKKSPSSGVAFRGGMIAVLLYGVIGAQVLVTRGLTIVGLVLLLVMLALPVAGMVLADRLGRIEGPAADAGRAIVGVGLAAAMLIAAGQTLAMLGLVDPRTTVVVIALVTGLLVALDGLRASGRIGSLAVWLLIVPILLCLALGVMLGSFGQAVNSIIVTPGVSVAAVVCLCVAFLVLGAADAALVASRGGGGSGGWSPVRLLAAVFAVVVLLVFGMLMFFGGAILAPTVQFFVVPANLNALPGLAGVILAILTLLFAAFVASCLGGVGQVFAGGAGPHPRAVAVGAVVAAAVALVDPGLGQVVIVAALVAAAVAGARAERGVRVGLVVVVVAAAVLALTGTLEWGWWSALGIVVVALAARLGSGRGAPDAAGSSGSTHAPQTSEADSSASAAG